MISEIEDFFQRQLAEWPDLAQGIQRLACAETRQVRIEWFNVFVRHIPHRIASTIAPVDSASIRNRSCFLCPHNLPPQEQPLRFNSDFNFYCNPFPILDRHLTVVHREHRPQRIASSWGAMLDIAKALPGYFALYNGPECGASAPDHMHFQACSRELFPIEGDSARHHTVFIPEYARQVLILRDRDQRRLVERLESSVEVLSEITAKKPEPMINVAVFFEAGEWAVFLFPRAKHRPTVFHSGKLTVSPGAIDMCGVVVVPIEEHFRKMSVQDIALIYKEVTLPEPEFRELVSRVGLFR